MVRVTKTPQLGFVQFRPQLALFLLAVVPCVVPLGLDHARFARATIDITAAIVIIIVAMLGRRSSVSGSVPRRRGARCCWPAVLVEWLGAAAQWR